MLIVGRFNYAHPKYVIPNAVIYIILNFAAGTRQPEEREETSMNKLAEQTNDNKKRKREEM
jgi:hypothetical protein